MTNESEFAGRTDEAAGLAAAEPSAIQEPRLGQEVLVLLVAAGPWIAKKAKDKFYKLIDAAALRPQKIRHRDGRNLIMMSEEAYTELLAGWKMAKKSESLADRFRAAKITQSIERPGKFKQRRPRALDLLGEIEESGRVKAVERSKT